MWDFDEDGELFYEKALTGFFPTLFKKWNERNTNHVVSIILFSRIFYNHIDEAPENDNAILYDSNNRPYKDFYRVVIDFETRTDWSSVLTILKREFVQFQKDILQRSENGSTILSGNISPACEGNVLEAINLALNPFDKQYMDRNILRTGLSIVVVTPGTGIFEVDKKLLRLTTQRMIDNGISLDLVCLSRPPLYLVPLMQYYSKELSVNTNQQESVDNSLSSFNEKKIHKNESFEKPGDSSEKKIDVWDPLYFDDPNNDNPEHIFYSIPYWIDCSFWNNNQDTENKNNNVSLKYANNNNEFLLRCKMYDIQMMGITEQAGSSILVPYLDSNSSDKINSSIEQDQNFIDYDRYDESLFHYDQKSHSRTRFNARIVNTSHNITPDNTYSVINPIKVSDSSRSIDIREENPIVSQRNKMIKDSASATSSVVSRRLYAENNLRFEPIRTTTSIKINNSNSSNFVNEINIPSSYGNNGMSMLHNPHLKSKLELQKSEMPLNNVTNNGTPNFNAINAKTFRKSYNDRGEKPKSYTSNINIEIDQSKIISEMDNGEANSVNTDTSKNTQVAPICIKHSTRYNYTGSYRDTDNRNSISESLKFCSPQNDPSKHIVKVSPGKPGTIRHIKQNYINPCNPSKNKMRLNSHICRWHHVFPKSVEPTSNKANMKWKSLCTPASLPLTTDFFPKQDDLRDYYEEYTYALAPDDEYILYPENSDDSLNFTKRIDSLLKEMISQRLSKGFQLIISNITSNNVHMKQTNVSDNLIGHTNNSVENRKYPSSFKDEVSWPQLLSKQQYFLSLGDHLHKLYYDSTRQNIEIKRYVRKLSYSTSPITYKCCIWPKSQDFYQTRTIIFKYPSLATYNWNYLDHFISGSQKDTADSLEFLSARFILIPLDTVPQNSTLLNPTNEQLDEEELRIAGFSKFIDVFEKLKWSERYDRDQSTSSKRTNKSNILRKIQFTTYSITSFTPNPLDIKRQIQLYESRHSHRRGSVQMAERLSKNSSIESIAHAMQHADGVPCRDRRWHFRVYERTFIGSDFVEWMIRSFHDIETREEAVEFGNHLLNKGMFEHATKKHKFLDGFYFYRLRAEFSLPKDHPDRGAMRWFRTQKNNLQDSVDSFDESDRLPFKLSQSLMIDVDPLQKSNRSEVATLHYDTVYNPMNCYHFQLHWLVCTARLIEDQLTSWSRFAERCGFKLVEAPYQQVQQYSNANPFQSVSVIKLALQPPNIDLIFQQLENNLPYYKKTKSAWTRTDSNTTNSESEIRRNSLNDNLNSDKSYNNKEINSSSNTDSNEKEKTPIKENTSNSEVFEVRKNSNNSEISIENKKSNINSLNNNNNSNSNNNNSNNNNNNNNNNNSNNNSNNNNNNSNSNNNNSNNSSSSNNNNTNNNTKPLQLRDIEIPMYWYESELLKYFGFVLDLESDHQFKYPVKYSYEKPENKNIQFVHRSGMAFVQICEEDHTRFLWVNNSLYNMGKSNINANSNANSNSNNNSNNNNNSSNNSINNSSNNLGSISPETSHSNNTSENSSPISSDFISKLGLNSSSLTNIDLLHEHFQKFCQDPKKLQELWEKSTQKLLLITKGMNKQLEEISDESMYLIIIIIIIQ